MSVATRPTDQAVEPPVAEREPPAPRRRRVRAALGRIPRLGLVIAAIAVVHGAVWAFTMPPLQGPDEPSHISYVEYLLKTGTLPVQNQKPTGNPGPLYSKVRVMFERMPFSAEGPPEWSPGQRQAMLDVLRHTPGQVGSEPLYLWGNPPLYYAFDAGLVKLSGAQDERTRILVMRLGSALIFGLAAFFVFMFVREIVPRPRWAPAAGGLAFAFHPVAASMGGAVNPEILLAAAGAAMLFLVARTFRRGLTPARAAAIAVVAAVGLLTRLPMAGLLPGVAIGCLWVVARQWRNQGRRRALLAVGSGVVLFAFVMVAWLYLNDALFERSPTSGSGGLTSNTMYQHATWGGQLSYIWQFYLPRIPPLHAMFGRWPEYPVWDVWIQGFIGRFGWHQYNFPQWVNWAGLPVLLGIVALAVNGFRRLPGSFRRHLPEIATYSLMLAGLLFVIHYAGYRYRFVTGGYLGPDFEQARYTLSMWGLYAVALAIGVRGLGSRWGPRVCAGLLGMIMVFAFAADLLTIQRYYA